MNMELSKQVTSLELSKRLKELGAVHLMDHYGYFSKYYVTPEGKIYSTKYGWLKELIPSESKGYLRINLSEGNRRFMFPVHRIVAKVFLKNKENKPHVNHKDGNKQNNQVENLEWCTASENMQHASKMLKRPGSKTGYRFSNMYPSEATRNRLIALGIPRNRHNLADLGEMLPITVRDSVRNAQFAVNKTTHWWRVGYENGSGWMWHLETKEHLFQKGKTEAEACGLMLAYLLENKLMSV